MHILVFGGITVKESKEKKSKLPPAMSEEAREKQMIALAVDCVEERMRTGKASASEYVYYLKIASTEEKKRREKLEEEIKLLRAKTEAYESGKQIEKLYADAISAMSLYSGNNR